MEFSEVVLAAVIGGLILAAILGVVAWLWSRRRRPLDWAKTGRAAAERRRRQIAKAEHDQLVDWVLQRADTLKVEVAAGVTRGPDYVTVTNHPSGDQFYYFHDLATYHDAMTSGRYPQRRTFSGTHPTKRTPVRDWSDEQLRTWLTERADQLPPIKAKP